MGQMFRKIFTKNGETIKYFKLKYEQLNVSNIISKLRQICTKFGRNIFHHKPNLKISTGASREVIN